MANDNMPYSTGETITVHDRLSRAEKAKEKVLNIPWFSADYLDDESRAFITGCYKKHLALMNDY
ncbi:MAG: hypothetical protein HZB65_02310 [Candidatus Aenigmarchaeota archaeon]|nr:hypothetical protein [Candidatus Aenigmarchaeota archaeon]